LATTVTSSLGFTFKVNSVPVTVNSDMRLNIKKRKEQVLYRTLSNRDNINLGYCISQDLSPQSNLFISDRSTFLVQNRIPAILSYTKATTAAFTLSVDQFLITNQFTTETATQPAEPLFYYHKLIHFNADLTDFAYRDLLSLEFGDYLLKNKTITEYVTTTTGTNAGKVYNNVENAYDNHTTEFDVTYVKYSVRYTDPVTSAQTVSVYHELLDNHPIFSEATFDHIDDWGNLIAGYDVYLISELPGGEQFEILLPTVDTYAYKELATSRIKILEPDAFDTNSPWYLKITNGKFLTSLETGNGTSANFRYRIPEFDTQLFDPYPPYKQHREQRAVWLNYNLVKVPTSVIWDLSTGFYVDIVVRDSTNTVKYAYTNNLSKLGTLYNNSILYTDGILSVDETNGFIELADTINDDYKVLVSYVAEETTYELTTIDFNPLSNTDILNSRVVLYMVPESATTGDLDSTVFYLLVDSLGSIQYSSQVVEGPAAAASTQRMLNEDFTSAGSPVHTFYYDYTSTASGLRATQSGYYSAFMDEFSFIDKYTVESILTTNSFSTASGLYGGTVGSGELFKNLNDNPKCLVLADVYVGEAVSPEQATIMDIRTRGGGIKEENEEDAYKEQPESMWNWDHNSRVPYPGALTFLAEVPRSILTEFGGTFTLEQIRGVIEKHAALGSYACIRPYGPVDPVLTNGVGLSGMINIGWPTYGSDYTYSVYRSTLRDGTYTAHNTTPIADVPTGNSYTMTGLDLLRDYYIYIAAEDENEYEYPSPVYKITTTAT
jgi:hypothetical protein